MLLIKDINPDKHVSIDTLLEFETSILLDPTVSRAKPPNKYSRKFIFFFYRILRKIGYSLILKTREKYLQYPLADSKHLIAVMMGLNIGKYSPFAFITNHCRSVYLFDAWPTDYNKIVNFVNTYKIDYLFISASQSAKYLSAKINSTKVFWIPEGINVNEYKYLPIENKTIDVLALGRRYDWYHEHIVDYCNEKQLSYYFEKNKGELVFPTRQEFIVGLASSKISICVPSNITHPQRSGNIETLTIRYLQSMLSKCLVVGHAPLELVELFGYNPVVEINMENPVEQLDSIVHNYSDYMPLIEKNYQMVLLHNTWTHRWNKIKHIYTANPTA